jgi:hypothetical protein
MYIFCEIYSMTLIFEVFFILLFLLILYFHKISKSIDIWLELII